MTPESKPVLGFDLADTPRQGVFSVAHTVDFSTKSNILNKQPTPYTTLYKNFTLDAPVRTAEFGDYMFTYYVKAAPMAFTYYFVNVLASQNTADPFETIPGEEPSFPWPAVLTSFHIQKAFVSDPVTFDTWIGGISHTAVWKHKAYHGICPRTIEHWWSATPWPLSVFDDVSPAPTGFSYDFILDKFDSGPALHGNITITTFSLGPHPVYGDVNFDAVSVALTAPTDWQDTVASHDQHKIAGGFLRERVTMLVPDVPPWV